MHRSSMAVWLIVCIASSLLAQDTKGKNDNGVRLDSLKVERSDADHFHSVIVIVNRTNSVIYVQRATDGSSNPYPMYLERLQEQGGWEQVAPCVDLAPAGVLAIKKSGSLTVDLVYPLELPSSCKIRRIDPSSKFRWRIEYFTNKEELWKYERTGGHSGKVFSAKSEPFSIKE